MRAHSHAHTHTHTGPPPPPPPPPPHTHTHARYLTFCSYTLQMLQLLVCCLAHVARVGAGQAGVCLVVAGRMGGACRAARALAHQAAVPHPPACLPARAQEGKRRRRLAALADTLSCAAFSLANTVTAMFYAIESSTKGLVEGGAVHRPAWLNAAVHSVNAVVRARPLLVCGRRGWLCSWLGTRLTPRCAPPHPPLTHPCERRWPGPTCW